MRITLATLILVACGDKSYIHTIDSNAVYIDNYACTINAVNEDGKVRPMEDFQADLEACAMFHNICLEGTNDGTTCR